jgi:hypothetical protein
MTKARKELSKMSIKSTGIILVRTVIVCSEIGALKGHAVA